MLFYSTKARQRKVIESRDAQRSMLERAVNDILAVRDAHGSIEYDETGKAKRVACVVVGANYSGYVRWVVCFALWRACRARPVCSVSACRKGHNRTAHFAGHSFVNLLILELARHVPVLLCTYTFGLLPFWCCV